jgi:acetyl-CoA carboxylase carboxyl transferase subunit beta
MSWFKRDRKSIGVGAERKVIPEGLWQKCDNCKEPVWKKEIDANLQVCPKCDHHYKIGARDRLDLLFDEGSWKELDAGVHSTDPLEFVAAKPYADTLAALAACDGPKEAVVTGAGKLGGFPAVIGAMEYRFIGGSMGSVVGEKITRAIEHAHAHRSPLVIVSCSGGARMQEGALSLMQMAKIASALSRLDREGIPYISVLTDPTTGGVTASYAMLGDLNIAEPGALIGFAGPRVIEQTIRQKLPEGFQRSEFLLKHGFLDAIVERPRMKTYLEQFLKFFIG